MKVLSLSVLTAVFIYATVTLWVSFVDNYNLMKTLRNSEDICIAHWISQGVERRNIVPSDGTCSIITNQGE